MRKPIEFEPRPADGVHSADPDGTYLHIGPSGAQVIIMGPMDAAPVDYERALRAHTGKRFKLESSEFMCTDHVCAEIKEVVLRRGMISLIFKEEERRGKVDGRR